MAHDAYSQFHEQLKGTTIPEIDAEDPWYTYVRNPSYMASRVEFFGLSFYHFYVSQKRHGGYSIRYIDVRSGCNPWHCVNIKAQNLDHLHQLAWIYFRTLLTTVAYYENFPEEGKPTDESVAEIMKGIDQLFL